MFDTESNWSFQSTERGSFCSQVSVINVVLIVDNEEREMIPNVPVKRDLDDSICLAPLLSEIEKSGYSLEATQIYYYSMENDWFVFCGRHPSLNINMIPEKELDLDCLTLKVKHPLDLSALRSSDDEAIVADLFTSSQEEEKKEEPVAPGRRGKKSAKGRASSKRSTERKIGFVIEQVARWRQMYKNGIEKDGKLVGYSLQDAAKVIGISKKSLDDYLLQIRYGKKFGFDFQKHSESGVGVLRAFNKQHRDRMTLKKKPETDDDWMNFQSKCFTPFDEDTSCGESSNGSHSPRIEPEFDAIEMSLLASH